MARREAGSGTVGSEGNEVALVRSQQLRTKLQPAPPVKSPPKGFRPKPGWVPSLEIRLAMVKSPRKAKPKGGPGMAKAASQANGLNKQAAQQQKKAIAQMGGVNGFAPKAGGKPAGGAKPKAGAAAVKA